jgi:hypothetical protein
MEQDNWDFSNMDVGETNYNDIFLSDEYSYTGNSSIYTTNNKYVVMNNPSEKTSNTSGKMSMMVYVKSDGSLSHRYLMIGSYQTSGIGSGDWKQGVLGGIHKSTSSTFYLRNSCINIHGTSVDNYQSVNITPYISMDRWYKIQLTWKRFQCNSDDSNYGWYGLTEFIDQNTDEVISSIGNIWDKVYRRSVLDTTYNVGIVAYSSLSDANYMDDWKLYET